MEKSKYFIAHILSSGVRNFCIDISADLAERFSIQDAHQRIPPHLTLKAPFHATDSSIQEIRDIMREVASQCTPALITASGFDHFNEGVIYLDIEVSEKVRNCSQILTRKLKQLSWMNFSRHDHDITFHATLARPNSKDQFQEIWKYLHEYYEPNLKGQFDNIALLQKEEGSRQWETVASYSFTKQN